MRRRVYVLIEASPGMQGKVRDTVAAQAGVVRVELVEGPVSAIAILEAADMAELADVTLNALEMVEKYTARARCLPVRQDRPIGVEPGRLAEAQAVTAGERGVITPMPEGDL